MLELNSLLVIDGIKGISSEPWLEKAGVVLNRVILFVHAHANAQASSIENIRHHSSRSVLVKEVLRKGLSPAEGSIDRETRSWLIVLNFQGRRF